MFIESHARDLGYNGDKVDMISVFMNFKIWRKRETDTQKDWAWIFNEKMIVAENSHSKGGKKCW